MKLENFLKKNWVWLALIFIFLFSYYIRSINIVPDRLLSFDPIFQYRFTKYLADWGHLPVWDEIGYYVGRFMNLQPFMHYVTVFIYWFTKLFGLSLMTTAAYMSAIYGALIVIPAFLLGRELSNKYGGLLAASLIGTAPAILTRTFGSSYDTDAITLFFIVLTLYLGIYGLKKRTIASFCFALIGFTAFMLTWEMFIYSYLILAGYVIVYFLLNLLIGKREEIKISFSERLKFSFKEFKGQFIFMVLLFIGLIIIGFITNQSPISSLLNVIGFAQRAEVWIVNISIAELQPFSIFSLEGWILATGRFVTGDNIFNIIMFIVIFLFIFFGLYKAYKKDINILSFLLTLFLIAVYTSFRGVRFTEFTSALFIVLIGVGFGYLVKWSLKKDIIIKTICIGAGVLIVLIAFNFGYEIGSQLGPDINVYWDDAWNFLKTQTPEYSLVGTWWDPGHMISGLAERRNIADGAHCKEVCYYTINDRIVDLGKIMATTDENESLKLIRKYQGNSPKVYWIASDDLIGKFRWIEYFGTGCDGTVNPNCPLYYQLGLQNSFVAGGYMVRNYGNTFVVLANIPLPIFVDKETGRASLYNEMIYYEGGIPKTLKLNQYNKTELIESLKPLEGILNVRITDKTMPYTIWIPQHQGYVVLIPPNLRNVVFTKMFMLEGQGLEHFKQVFRNEMVKIYEVI
ncbi:MAG: STT3 domain-containing protein [Candidatus Aenigmatarchaeota archaeon]